MTDENLDADIGEIVVGVVAFEGAQNGAAEDSSSDGNQRDAISMEDYIDADTGEVISFEEFIEAREPEQEGIEEGIEKAADEGGEAVFTERSPDGTALRAETASYPDYSSRLDEIISLLSFQNDTLSRSESVCIDLQEGQTGLAAKLADVESQLEFMSDQDIYYYSDSNLASHYAIGIIAAIFGSLIIAIAFSRL